MTDKQIIIDVSKCKECGLRNCEGNLIYWCHTYDDHCQDFDNCYYKQLKRKEKELIDYKKQFKADTKEMEDYQNEITRHLESIEYWQHQAETKEQECETLASQLDFEVQKKECLEKECEELKKIINEAKNSKLDLNSFFAIEATVGEYQLELDQLKAENDKYSLFIEKLCDYAGLECDNEEQAMRILSDLASQMNKARWIIDRYKQTLTEIKEICNNNDELKGDFNLVDCDKYKLGKHNLANRILQKISEVE